MLNRAFFSLQSAWVPTVVALGNLGLNVALNAVLYRVGVWGIPLATSIVNIAGTAALLVVFRQRLGRIDGKAMSSSYARISVASAAAAGAGFGAWFALDELFGRSLGAQVASVGLALVAATGAYFLAARVLAVRELATLLSLRRRSATTD